ncbi:alkylhydroperoxidase/carboxymuconolactone decarboxylase family protein YurZ [Caldicoprobacter guelmensis]|uniref:carboxymuconolactone decarboxylase family protein n=1 Tax=Caldicoprobacter guelmensis TaxID=1170224 RepID=UPI00195BDBAA|nr:carboxymuconolactone decarboxylase family protein [Caldicoprobacter guelmensis]MBM7581472.1 alkylhydroperoxidase/carboxymuconolactone decarboxylase family protein YurZ [Caldicoprobacter guelmensis]
MPLPPFLAPVGKSDPDFGKVIEEVYALSMGEGALDQKTKLLIALAVDAVHGAAQGVTNIARLLKSMGVTDEEIREALRIAYFASGNAILASYAAAFPENK